MVAPELVQQIIASISPVLLGGRRIISQEFQQVMAALTSIITGLLVVRMIGMLTGAVAEKFAQKRLLEIKVEEIERAIKLLPDPPEELVHRIVDRLREEPSRETYEWAIHLLCDWYKIRKPKVWTQDEAHFYIVIRGPGWERLFDIVEEMANRVPWKTPGATMGAVFSSFRGLVEGADAIVFSYVLLRPENYYYLLDNLFHEFYHWLFIEAIPLPSPDLIEPFLEISERMAKVRTKELLLRTGVRR